MTWKIVACMSGLAATTFIAGLAAGSAGSGPLPEHDPALLLSLRAKCLETDPSISTHYCENYAYEYSVVKPKEPEPTPVDALPVGKLLVKPINAGANPPVQIWRPTSSVMVCAGNNGFPIGPFEFPLEKDPCGGR